jgi:hypothetical protein
LVLANYVSVPEQENKYLSHYFDGKTLQISINDNYKDWEKTEV